LPLARENHHMPLISSHRARVALAGMVVGVALALSACGSATSSSTGTRPAAATTSASGGSQTATATTTVTRTTTDSGPPVCRAAALKLTFLGRQGATGHGELGFAVHNTSASTCDTFGYPGVQFSSQSGALLPTVTHRTTNDFFGLSPLATIMLTPGATASFRLGVTHGNGSSAGCTTAYGVRVYPPNDTATLRVSVPGGATECGTATVSPMRPQTSAYP
jgi:hypothetical protein